MTDRWRIDDVDDAHRKTSNHKFYYNSAYWTRLDICFEFRLDSWPRLSLHVQIPIAVCINSENIWLESLAHLIELDEPCKANHFQLDCRSFAHLLRRHESSWKEWMNEMRWDGMGIFPNPIGLALICWPVEGFLTSRVRRRDACVQACQMVATFRLDLELDLNPIRISISSVKSVYWKTQQQQYSPKRIHFVFSLSLASPGDSMNDRTT